MRLLVLLAVILSGCGGGSACDGADVSVGDTGSLIGYAECGAITISPTVDTYDWRVAVLRHEIGHILGLAHVADPACVMNHYIPMYGEPSLCQLVHSDLVTIRAAGGMYSETVDAARYWSERGARIEVVQ